MRQRDVSIIRIIILTLLFVLIINFAWIWISELPLYKLSLYNRIFSGRERFPFGEDPSLSYNLTLFDLDAMIASHEVNASLDRDYYKIFLLGDSSVWGFLQQPEETLSGLLNSALISNEEKIRVYNLGYPSISLLKDLMIIENTLHLEPDMIIWLTTLEAFPYKNQFETPILEGNPKDVNRIIDRYNLTTINKADVNKTDFQIINQRRNIADRINLQKLGFLWETTGIDQYYPEQYNQALRDFPEPMQAYYGAENEEELEEILAFDIIEKGIKANPDVNFVLINEPILISAGINSELQYNFYYPRWAYDHYRGLLKDFSTENDIEFYDFWDLVDADGFTNSAIHLDPRSEKQLAQEILGIINKTIEN